MDREFHLHLVSDSTAETVSSIARAVMSQFDEVEAKEHIWPLIRTRGQVEKVLDSIEKNPGVVLYTIMNRDLNDLLYQGCAKLKVPCIAPLSRVIADLSSYLKMEAKGHTGRQHEMDEEYFARVEAINFTIAHDDGQAVKNLEEADVVLVGVSRTSKSPTSVYLAHRGLRAANIPYVLNVPLPDNLFTAKKPLIVGLTISPDRLVEIRKSRLVALKEKRETSYTDPEAVLEEMSECRKLFTKQGWPVIDVTRKSVEEVAALIIQQWQQRR